MALSRKYLQGMGLTEEQINAIVEANEETITGLKAEIEKYKTASEKSESQLSKVQKDLDTFKKAAEESDSKNPWKVKYEGIKEEFENFKTEEKAKATKSAKIEAYKKLCKEVGVSEKRIDAIIKVTSFDDIKLDKDGKLEDVDNLKTNIKTEWSDFIVTEGTKGANTSTPPSNTGGKMSKDDILAIKDTMARQKAMAENSELFGI